jgi:alcohol dehydrogenase class IV
VFEFATAGRVVFGAGRAAELPALAAGLGSRALLCTGSDPTRYAAVTAPLTLPAETVRVTGEPTVESVRAAAAAARDHGADVVVAVGGGSVLDAAKAVAMLLANGGDPVDYLEVVGRGRPVRRRAVPCLAVPTTAGTGAEVTANAVLASPGHRVKASLRSPLMLPSVALVDPALTLDCPPPVTASAGLDALTQCLEPYVCVRANPLTDCLARSGLRHAAAGLRRAYSDGSDLDARTAMSTCSLFGGMALANAKLGAIHGVAGVLGGMISIPHGVACAALLAPVVEVNVARLRAREPDNPALARYGELARLLTGRPEASVEDGLAWIRDTVARLDVPPLGAFGLRREDWDQVVAGAARSSSMQGNPIRLTEDDLHEILARAAERTVGT